MNNTMDNSIAKWIFETFAENKIVANIAKILTWAGSKYAILLIVAILLIFKKTRKIGLCALFSCGIVYIFNDFILKFLVQRDRPFVLNSEYENLSALAGLELPKGYSFASGHSAITMALAVSVFCYNKKLSIPAFIYSILVGLSRIVLNVHFATDVLAGFAIGIIFAVIVYFGLKIFFKLIKEKFNKKMKKIIFASNNKHKLNEVRKILSGYEVISLKDIGFEGDIEENGQTLAENAEIKALAVKKFCDEKKINYPIFADDTGLFVEALGGEPGIYSARYAGNHDDEQNRQKLLNNLKRSKNRKAYFECTICLIMNDIEQIFVGKTYGSISKEYKGDTSFGYDCIFYSDDLNKTFGEATSDEKDSVSHRGRAVEEMKKHLK